MTNIFKHAELLPDDCSHSDAFESLHAQLNYEERNDAGYMHDIAVALAKRAERITAKALLLSSHHYCINGIGETRMINNYELIESRLETLDEVVIEALQEFKENNE